MTLEQLATKIKAEHDQVIETMRKPLQHARKAGEFLAKAKALIEKDGLYKWGKWAEHECGIHERTASNYIRVFNNWAEIEKSGDPASMTLRAALGLLKKRTRSDRRTRQAVTMSDLKELMTRHGIDGDPDELLELLKDIGVKVPVSREEPVAATA